MKDFLSASAFARIVQKDKKTVIRWIAQGRIPRAKRVGHAYRIPAGEVEVYQQATQYPTQ
jgi:excisionase family DNA binding protein